MLMDTHSPVNSMQVPSYIYNQAQDKDQAYFAQEVWGTQTYYVVQIHILPQLTWLSDLAFWDWLHSSQLLFLWTYANSFFLKKSAIPGLFFLIYVFSIPSWQ